MMFATVKSKIIVLTFSLLCLLALLLTGAAFYAFHNDKELIIAANNASITAFTGHCPPLRKTASGYDYVPVVRNLMLGVMPNYTYEAGHFTLKPGDHLFLYTDGVTEAQTADEKLYGPDRLKRVLNRPSGADLSTLECVRRGIAGFVQGANQSDDITMMEIIFYKKIK